MKWRDWPLEQPPNNEQYIRYLVQDWCGETAYRGFIHGKWSPIRSAAVVRWLDLETTVIPPPVDPIVKTERDRLLNLHQDEEEQAMEQLRKELLFIQMRKEHPSYITFYLPAGGWQSLYMTWDEECNGYTPEQTGMGPYGLGKEAYDIARGEAQSWAEDEGVEFREGKEWSIDYERAQGFKD